MWIFKNKFLQTHLPSVDRALLALGQQLSAAFATAVDPIANIAAFAGFAGVVSTWPEGTKKYVQTVRDTFTLIRTSAPMATDGITVVPAGPANTYWIRDLIPASSWGKQTTWYVNPAAVGSDEASGVDQAHPLKTFAEWKRRVGRTIRVVMVVNLVAAIPITDPIDFNVDAADGASLSIIGVLAPLAAGTITAVTQRNPATNTPNNVTDAGQAWGPLLGKLIRFTMAGGAYAWAWAVKDLGGGQVRITAPMSDTNLWVSAETVLVGNEAYEVFEPTAIHVADGWRIVGSEIDGANPGTLPKFLARFLLISDDYAATNSTAHLTSALEQSAYLDRCSISGFCIDAWVLTNCLGSQKFLGMKTVDRVAQVFGGGSLDIDLVLYGAAAGLYIRFAHAPFLMQSGTMALMNDYVLISGTHVGIFDSDGDGITFLGAYLTNNAGKLQMWNVASLYGANNAGWGCNLQQSCRIEHGGNLANITLTGALGQINVGGASALMPNIEVSAGGSLPAVSACVTWAQILAAPFNGQVLNYANGAFVGPGANPTPQTVYTNWALQATWYIDAAAGSDANTGVDAGHPIKTFAEWKRRVGRHIRVNMDLYLLTSLPSTDPFDLEVYIHNTAKLYVHGTLTQVDAGVLTARTARAPATNTPNDVTDATGAGQNWAAHLGQLVHFTVADAWAWVAKDLGANKGRLSVPTQVAMSRGACAEFLPAGNEAYTIHTLTEVYLDRGMVIEAVQADPTLAPGGLFYMDDVKVHDTSAQGMYPCVSAVGNAQPIFRRCQLYGTMDRSNVMMCCSFPGQAVFDCSSGSAPIVIGCIYFGTVVISSQKGAYLYNYKVASMGQGATVLVGGELYCPADFCAFDSAGSGIAFVGPSGGVRATGKVYGAGNTSYGMDIGSGNYFRGTVSNNTITGTTGDVRIGGLTSLRPDLDDGGIAAVMPATAVCGTWAAITAAPFNGRVLNKNNLAYCGP